MCSLSALEQGLGDVDADVLQGSGCRTTRLPLFTFELEPSHKYVFLVGRWVGVCASLCMYVLGRGERERFY